MSENDEKFNLPERGVIYWPVGNGDSTTIIIDDEHVMQVDLNNLADAEEEEDSRTPVVERLVEILPKRDGEPYLAVFGLTHPDQDHCRGFADLLDRVTIGELWFAPRVFREFSSDLCKDAKDFKKEAKRRVEKSIENNSEIASGDRVRIIGYDDLLGEEDYDGFPENRLTIPGNAVTELDGEDFGGTFRAFIHAPFKDDSSGERNETSIAMQVTLENNEEMIRTLLFGDLGYPTLKRIYDVTDEEENVEWNVILAPHHCSKSAMYWQDEDEEEESLKQDILNNMEDSAEENAWIIASSEPVPSSNESGDNPPHAIAKNRYEEIIPDGHFICTQEYSDEQNHAPIIFQISGNGIVLPVEAIKAREDEAISSIIDRADKDNKPPSEHVSFGNNI